MTRSHPLRSLSMHCARQPLSVSLQSGGGGHTPRPSGEGGHTPRPSCTFEELKYIYIYTMLIPAENLTAYLCNTSFCLKVILV